MDTEKSFWLSFLKNKKILILILIDVIGFVLLIAGERSTDMDESDGEQSYYSVRFYTEEMEARIADLCRQIHGVSEVHVLLTMEGSSEYVYAENTSGSARDYVILQKGDGSAPVQVHEIYPKIRGVAVVCTRGGDSEMQRTITELLSAALGISASRIRVAGT